MNPLILSTFDVSGGAAKAAFRLHDGLRNININSQMLVQYKTSSDPSIITNTNKLEKLLNQMRPTVDNLPLKFYPKHDYGTFSPQWFPDFINYKIKHLSPDIFPDIINIHWACGYLKIESIAKFKQPLVWTLHDMWAFTGGCHYSLDCKRYTDSCGNCAQINSHQEWDLSSWVWKRKAKAWQNINLMIVTPSRWLAKVARQSSLFKDYPIKVIPNGIDTKKYKPIDRNIARKWLNLPVDKKLILSGAAKSSSIRKGIHLLEKALQNLSACKNQVELIIFGSLELSELNNAGFKCHYIGNLHDDISLALIYAAADVFVTASIQDNLPNTVMEALASGTPCVAFDVGGISDMIEHQANGYLAQPFKIENLATGIDWILSNDDPQKICDRARKKVEQELSYEAKHDSLTNLPNRAAFIEKVEQTLKYCQKHPEHLFAVLFIDLDRFKIINDSLGHLIGDELLIYVAKVLTNCSRSGDFVARLGGDEFTILLGQIDSIEDANAIAERIQIQLKTPFNLQGHTVFTSASIGIVIADNQYQDSAHVLRDADIAMYRAKSDGKARHEVFDEKMYAETRELLEIENDLRNAILHKELLLFYQPIVSLDTDTLYGFEALLRWNHPTKGLIYPDKFIHIAEETGLIQHIGRWVIETACRQLRIWQVQYPGAANLKMGVNVASQQMKDQKFLSILDRTLEQTGLSGKSLHLEITESTLMDYEPETISLFNKIRHRGIQINIDDFGTGYSSLQYLNRFPISTLKIDRSFTKGMLQDKENFEIIKTIIALARTLKIEVVAEGVENVRQLQILKKLNCKFGQGYLFSPAVECNSAESLINFNI